MKRFLTGLSLLALATTAQAEIVGGLGLARQSGDDVDLSFNIIVGSVGYKFDVNESFSVVPEVRIGTGISNETNTRVLNGVAFEAEAEIDSLYGVAVRGQYAFDKAYVYLAPSYTKFKGEVTARAIGVSASASATSDWEFGAAVGAGYWFTQSIAAEVAYEVFDDVDQIGVSARFRF